MNLRQGGGLIDGVDTTAVSQRIGKAILLGWGLRDPSPAETPQSRGSIWVSKPGEHDVWWSEKSSGKDWLVQCLNQAGIPE